MNRIRIYNDIFQVLHTPTMIIDPSMEFMIGSWSDYDLRGFQITEYKTLDDAQFDAFRLPDIDWYKLVRIHVDYFYQLSNKLDFILHNAKFSKIWPAINESIDPLENADENIDVADKEKIFDKSA